MFCGLIPGVTTRRTGGAERDRTDDLLLAKQALSQLSYSPVVGWLVIREDHSLLAARDRWRLVIREDHSRSPISPGAEVVGQGRLELPTSRLSSARSNQLSY